MYIYIINNNGFSRVIFLDDHQIGPGGSAGSLVLAACTTGTGKSGGFGDRWTCCFWGAENGEKMGRTHDFWVIELGTSWMHSQGLNRRFRVEHGPRFRFHDGTFRSWKVATIVAERGLRAEKLFFHLLSTISPMSDALDELQLNMAIFHIPSMSIAWGHPLPCEWLPEGIGTS